MEETVRRETAERERTAEKRWGMETDPPLSAGIVTDGKRPEAQIDLFADRAGIAAMAVVMGQFFCNEKEG